MVDASGTVDAEGKETRGYDPSVDIAWLRSEVEAWILGNLKDKWGSIRRRHIAVKATATETLQNQFSGYGSTATIVNRTLDRMGIKEPLEEWSNETVAKVVSNFIEEKFPTVIALNKIDHPDADKNIAKIAKMQDPNTIVLCSAVSEIFLRKMTKQGYIKYVEGSEFVDTREDLIEQGDPTGGNLKELDEKNKNRIENLRDMVLYRFGSTGVVQVLTKAADLLGLVPVFPVRSTTTFQSGANDSKVVFRDCVLVKKGSTVADVAKKVMGDAPIAYIEGIGNIRVSEDDTVGVGKNDVSLKALFFLICSKQLTMCAGIVVQSRQSIDKTKVLPFIIHWRIYHAILYIILVHSFIHQTPAATGALSDPRVSPRRIVRLAQAVCRGARPSLGSGRAA